MKPTLAILSHEVGDLWRVLQAADESPEVVGPLPGLISAKPNPSDLHRLAESVNGSANVAMVMSEMPADSWIREACVQLDQLGIQLRLVLSKSALARDGAPSADSWLVTTGSGISATPLGRNAPGTQLVAWSQASKTLYERFVECARNNKGRDLGQLKIGRGRMLAAVHGGLLADVRGKTTAVGSDGHTVEYSPSEVESCLAELRGEVSERFAAIVPGDVSVVVTEEAAAWVGRALGASREPRVLTLRQQYERTRVVLATATPEAGTVLVVEDQIGQPRTLSWMAENRTTHGHSGKQGWPRAAVIAVATLGLAFVATGATAIWYRTQWKTAEATLLAKPTDQTPTKVPPADAPTPPASPESGKSDTGPSTDFVDDVTGVRFVLVCKIDLSLPEGRNLTVDLPFWAATTEVTVEQFAAFAKAAGHKTSAESSSSTPTWRNAFDSGKLNLPVVYVTPSDAEKFVRWMSDRTGRKIEVPDATRWELAARAGALTRYAFGGGLPSDSGAVFKPKVLSPASTGKPNGAGLIGVHGNVAELARLPDGKWVRLGGSFRSWGRDAAFVDPQKAAEADSQRGDAATGFRPIILGSGS